MRLAVVDLGTNTCRLLLAEIDGGAIVRRDVRETHVVRLGQGVDRNGELDGAAEVRTRQRLADYAARIDAYAPDRRLLVATSVLRDATDGAEFLAAVERDFGLPYRVVGGDEEARLAFRGATASLDLARNLHPAAPSPVSGPPDVVADMTSPRDVAADTISPPEVAVDITGPPEVAVVDIGGGSTEFAVGLPGEPPRFVRSLDMGAVRLTERFFANDPPTGVQWGEAAAFVDSLLDTGLPAGVRAAAATLVGVAGTFTTLVAHQLGLREYEPALVHESVLSVTQIAVAIGLFRALTSEERGRLAGIQKGREDVILAGAMIARAACRAFGVEAALVSEDDVLEGMALWLADGLPPLA